MLGHDKQRVASSCAIRRVFDTGTLHTALRTWTTSVQRKHVSCRVALALAVLGIVHPAIAATRTWNNASGGTFSTPGNWTGGLPGSADIAKFDVTGTPTYTVNFSNNPTNTSLLLTDDTVTLQLAGHTYSLEYRHLQRPRASPSDRSRRRTLNDSPAAPSGAESQYRLYQHWRRC